ncbi:hypothetical protein HDU99_001473 [Rhizoclosmatium hyalinum]|nr:hypothetical protein HDU99_001473 [Rhizoclosmatium hyalinum]
MDTVSTTKAKNPLVAYASKWTGLSRTSPDNRPVQPPLPQVFVSTVVSFLSILIVNVINQRLDFINGPLSNESSILIGSIGASAVLVYHAHESPLSQPSNVLWGHVLSAVIGVSISKLFNLDALVAYKSTYAPPLGVALSIAIMALTNTVHPPGGATALIAITGSPEIQNLGYGFVLRPVLTGVLAMLVCALVFNNLDSTRRYPKFWIQRYSYSFSSSNK